MNLSLHVCIHSLLCRRKEMLISVYPTKLNESGWGWIGSPEQTAVPKSEGRCHARRVCVVWTRVRKARWLQLCVSIKETRWNLTVMSSSLSCILNRSVLRDAELIKPSNIAESPPVLNNYFANFTLVCLYVCMLNAFWVTLSTLYFMDSY